MPKRIVLFAVLLVTLGSSVTLPAQEQGDQTGYLPGPEQTMDDRIIEEIKKQPLQVMFGASFMVANPQDTLRRAIEKFDATSVGYGFAFFGGYIFDPVPIALTGEFAANFYGGTSKRFIVSPAPSFRDTISYDVQNTQLPISISVRYQPNIATWVYPYVEGVGGVTIFSSMLEITRTNGEILDSDSESESSASWQYGVGAGLMIKLADIITLPNTLQRILFDVRMRYLWGTDVDVPAIKLSDDQTFSVQSATVPNPTMVLFNVGFTVLL